MNHYYKGGLLQMQIICGRWVFYPCTGLVALKRGGKGLWHLALALRMEESPTLPVCIKKGPLSIGLKSTQESLTPLLMSRWVGRGCSLSH